MTVEARPADQPETFHRRQVAALAATVMAFVGVTFTPRLFRRLFATELVNSDHPSTSARLCSVTST